MSDETQTQAVETPQEAPDTQESEGQKYDAAYVQKLRQEAAANRVKAKEAQEALEAAKKEAERAKLDEVSRLKAEIADRDNIIQAAREAEKRATLRADLTGKVSDADLAMSVAPTFVREDGSLDLSKMLEAHPALKPSGPTRAAITPGNPTRDPREGAPLTLSDMQGKDIDWIRKNWSRLDDGRGTGIKVGKLKK